MLGGIETDSIGMEETKMERNRIGWKRRMVMIMIIKKIIYQHH